jgi:predicted Zn-dependent protease
MKLNARRLLAVITIPFCLSFCADSPTKLDITRAYTSEIKKIIYEVDYMAQAEPYLGNSTDGKPVWNFLKNNVAKLFNNTKTVTVPTTLSDMELIPTETGNYSQTRILELARTYRQTSVMGADFASIYILFLNGFFETEGKADTTVLGVSIGSSGVIAIFKRAIEINTIASQRLRNFVEQSVLIHESGHTLGLVNNGLPLTNNHQDIAHGAHCTNDDCVMYYLNEGVQDLLDFLSRGNPSTETIVFGAECLDDATGYIQLQNAP